MYKFIFFFAFVFASCSSARMGEFYISAVDTSEKEVVCAVFNESEPLLNEKNEPIKTPAWIKINFKERSQGSGFEPAKIGVRAVEIGPDGKIIRGLQEGDSSAYLEDWRFIAPTDTNRQLFILRRNKASVSN